MQDQVLSEILAFCALFIAGQGVGILLLLFSAKKKNTVFYLLVTYIALNCFLLVIEYFIHSHISLPGIVLNIGNVYILKGGTFYLYVKSLTTPGFRIQWKHAVHLLPLGLIFLENFASDLYPGRLTMASLYIAYYSLLVGYCIAAARLMPDYGKYIKGYFSSIGKISLDWLYKLIIVYLVSSFIFLVLRVVEFRALVNDESLEFVYVNNAIIFFICFYLIALGGYRRELTGIEVPAEDTDKITSGSATDLKNGKPRPDEEASREVWQKLNAYMRKKEPFLNEGLNLYELASAIDTSPRNLSQLLNTFSGQSFYDFVNGYRAEKARQLIEDSSLSEMPMVDIGFAAGFASKMTFYKYFKKHFSKTPLQYKKMLTDSAST